MSKTLFWYIFRDLLRIFFLASGALAAIMSFGGLLRPLTKQGLGLAEIAEMIFNLMPAMSTYSLPIAALFATTLVYGRLASENELTAIRAGGISHLAAATPGIVLGFLVAAVSIVMLCFVVPNRTLQVERVIYSNVARVLANSIERTHEFALPSTGATLLAQGARVLPPDPNDPTRQTVVLDSPLIINADVEVRPEGRLRIPKEFYTARLATVHIRSVPSSDEVEIVAQLEDGMSFPRKFQNSVTGGVEATQFGPQRVPPILAEKTKFMDLRKLWELRARPENARRIRDVVVTVNARQQRQVVLGLLREQLLKAGFAQWDGVDGVKHVLTTPSGTSLSAPSADDGELVLTAATKAATNPPGSSASGAIVRFESAQGSSQIITVDARRVLVRPRPNDATGSIELELIFDNAIVRAGGPTEEPTARDKFRRFFTIAMTPDVINLGKRSVQAQRTDTTLPPALRRQLDRALTQVNQEVVGELNARAAFAVSCVILVLVGVALGMMFKSGHFLSAFALSVVPALICILLATSGQHVLENVPRDMPTGWSNMTFGVTMIWIGNATVLSIASVLLYRLQRQ